MVHNARELGCRLGVAHFTEAAAALRQMVDRFVEVLDCLNTAFVDAGLLDDLHRPGQLGAVRVGGIDMNRPRARAVMEALLALSRDKVIRPLLAAAARTEPAPAPRISSAIDERYHTIHREMGSLFATLGMAA